jgi:hypothetical protein
VPIVRTLAAVLDCTRTGAGLVWDAYPDLACYEGAHLTYAVASVVTLLFFLPMALRYGAVDGDATKLESWRSNGGRYSALRLLRDGWWRDGARDFAGALSLAPTATKFNVVSTFARIALSLGDVMLTTHPRFLAVLFTLATCAQFVAAWRVPLFAGAGARRAHAWLMFLSFWSALVAIAVAMVNDASVLWPALLWWAGVAATLLGLCFAGGSGAAEDPALTTRNEVAADVV